MKTRCALAGCPQTSVCQQAGAEKPLIQTIVEH